MEETAKSGLDSADPFDFATKVESTSQLIDALAGDLRAGPESRLLVVRNQFDAHVTVLRVKFTAEAEFGIAALETIAGEQLGYDQPKEVIARALAEIDPKLKAIEARVKPPVAALEMPAPQQTRVVAPAQTREALPRRDRDAGEGQ